MAQYDPALLANLATRLQRRASYVAILYAVLAFAIGAPLGMTAVVGLNMVRRVQDVRTRADYDDLVHSEDKREEVVSLVRHAPLGALAAGLPLGVLGLLFGLARRTSLLTEGQTALCLVQLEANTRASGGAARV
jgi:hypothetical protein